MAWSVADLSSDEIAWSALDKPFFSNNALYNTSNAAGWDVGTSTGTPASATDDATGFEAERMFDGLPGLTSKPNASGTVFSIVFDRSTAPITFDWFGIINHNLDTLACTSLSLQIADNNTLTQNLVTLSSTNIASALSSDRRFADLTLKSTVLIDAQDETNYDGAGSNGTFTGGSGHSVSDVITLDDGTDITVDAVSAGVVTEFTVDSSSCKGVLIGNTVDQASTTGGGTGFDLTPGTANIVSPSSSARRYSNVPYIRLQIGCSSGTPYIGQVVLGRRRQQQYAPFNPWDPTNETSRMDEFESRSGVVHRTARMKGRRNIDALFRHDTSALQSDVLAWWDDIEGGEQPWFYVDQPNTNPEDFWMMFLRGPEVSMAYPYSVHATRDLRLTGIEQGPNFASLEGW